MKELKTYQCEICGTQYKSQQIAEQCEKFHKIPKEVNAIKYRSMNGHGEYPDYINVTFDDGSCKRYKYE